MRIGVDASRVNVGHRTGVEWYAYHLLRALAQLPESACHTWITYARNALAPDLKTALREWDECCLEWPPKLLWTQLRLSFEMAQNPPDLLFVPAHALPRILPKRTVVTVHDVGFHRFPSLYKAHEVALHEIYTRDIVQSNALMLTVSEFSKREIQELYQVPSERIVVTPLGVDSSYVQQSKEEQGRVRAMYQLGESPFILYVGRLEEKKNIKRLIEGFLSFAEEHSDIRCVLAGVFGYGWNRVQAVIKSHPEGHRITVLGYVDESHKPALMSAASCYVQPSLYEGFGLPVLEAMACGTPVVSSSSASLPEVGGEAVASYVDAASSASIASGIERVFAFSPSEREVCVERGKLHASKYNWHTTAIKTLRAIEYYG